MQTFLERLQKIKLSSPIPEGMLCPISGTIMNDPIIYDGVMFDRGNFFDLWSKQGFHEQVQWPNDRPFPLTKKVMDNLLAYKAGKISKEAYERMHYELTSPLLNKSELTANETGEDKTMSKLALFGKPCPKVLDLIDNFF